LISNPLTFWGCGVYSSHSNFVRLGGAPAAPLGRRKECHMGDSVYKFIEIVGTSTDSWEKAATHAVETAAKTLRDLRVAEIKQLDMVIEDGKVKAFRAKVNLSFKYEGT